MDLHGKLPSKDTRDILTSSAWNALIHHPVVEEENAEELPSTVDMDAIKGAPTTPLTAPTTPWSVEHQNGSDKKAESDGNSSDDDDDSDGSSRSSSGSDSDESESGSCSYSSSSSSRSSSCSSRSVQSQKDSPARPTFSVSKPDFDQGGLKLKISTLKSEKQNGVDSDSCSTTSQGKTRPVRKCQKNSSKVTPVNEPTVKKIESTEKSVETKPKEKGKIAKPTAPIAGRRLKQQPTDKKPPTIKKPSEIVKADNTKVASTRPVLKSKKVDTKKESDTSSSPSKRNSVVSKLRSVRKKPVAPLSTASNKSVAASSGIRHGRNPLSTTSLAASRSHSSTSDSSDSEDGEGSPDAVAHINELAQQLDNIGAPEALPSMTEHLQVINQEDLAAILPDVVTTEANAAFDGFEDVSSESGKAEKKDNGVQDSSSDVELPDTVVSDAIKRLDVDSENGENSDGFDKDTAKSTVTKTVNRHVSDEDSSSSDGRQEYSYSSSLLQQFQEKTEILSAQCDRLINSGRNRSGSSNGTGASFDSKTKRPVMLKSARADNASTQGTRAMPELEAYRLDCAQSNVSPDSGIQSVPGSPVNESTQRDSTPPVLRPVTPPERNTRKRGRPKKYRDEHAKNSETKKLSNSEDRSPVNNLIPNKRGPGRPKKVAAPLLAPNIHISDPNNLNFMLNEIYERVNRGLDLPSKGSRPIEMRELERIISDHKSSKARNSKIDALFSKSKKLSSVPNIAIVKPMQHHILNERKDDDEKHNKRGGRRGKPDKIDDIIPIKSDSRDSDICDKLENKSNKSNNERRKSERDKKPTVKPIFPIAKSTARPNRSRTRHLSSGTDGSCDKTVDCDIRKSTAKQEKTTIKKTTAKNVVKNLSSAVKEPCMVNFVHPMPRKVAHKKRPKYLTLRHSLLHHRHKRKKNKKSKTVDKPKLDGAWFNVELEKVINDFQKCFIDARKNLPTAPVAPTKIVAPLPQIVLSEKTSEPRNKRLGKKRKGEKSRGNEKEAVFEKSKQNESNADDPGKDREKEKPKRKQKKNHSDEVQGQTEANPNEQRLPLKKRHYHLTSESPGESSEDKSIVQENASQVRKESDGSVKKDDDCKLKAKVEGDRPENVESQRILRSSVEDAIEATINRFSSLSPCSSASSQNIETGQCSVIVTPKKRHRPEESEDNDEEESESQKTGGKIDTRTEGVIKSVGSAQPTRRSGSRSSSLNKERDKGKKLLPKTKKSDKVLRSVKKLIDSNDPSKTEPLHIDLPLLEAVKVECPNSDSIEMATLTPITEIKLESKTKLPVAGIFEPSDSLVEIDNSILVPLNSPSELGSNLKGTLSLKMIKGTQNDSEHILHKLDAKSVKINPNKKALENMKTVRVNLDNLSSTELLLKRVNNVKKKTRRRKNINRTGFPSSKKKKKKIKPILDNIVKTAVEPVIDTEANIQPVEISPAETDEEVPLKSVQKISVQIEEKLNAERVMKKRTAKKSSIEPEVKKSKAERILRPKEEPVAVTPVEPVKVNPAPVRKRKLANTIKNTKSKMKMRYQLPLLSMKKFKKAKCEEKVPSEDEAVPEAVEPKKKMQPRWKKKYLAAGLLSDYYKVDYGDKPPPKAPEKSFNKLVYNPEEHEHGLLPPPAYCNKFIRLRREDFLLPYDIWWLHSNNQLPSRGDVPSWNYKKIRTNIYYDVKPHTTGTNEVQACNCKLPSNPKEKGCGEDCINRMVFCECAPQLCPCKDKCSNQSIQRHSYAPGLDRFMTREKGWGVRSTLPIKSGDFILEYVGEVVSEKEFKERMRSRYASDTHHYCLHLDGGLVIDGHRMGGDGRFVNHSCEPNCEMQKWTVNGLFRMALFALRDIPQNQELTYDYNFSLFNPAEGQVCLCGAKTCRGVIGGKSQRVTVQGGVVQTAPVTRDKKNGRGRKKGRTKRTDKNRAQLEATTVKITTKPMSHQQRCFAQDHHCFLLRNVEKVRRGRDYTKPKPPVDTRLPITDVKPADVFYTQLNALSTLRSMKTRSLAQAEDNPELAKVAKLAYVFKDLYNAIASAKDEKDELLAAAFMTLPSKKKVPMYYTKISDPIDMTTIEQNINTGKYSTIEAFDLDVKKLFGNNVRFYGRTSDLGIAATRLKRTYNLAKLEVVPQLEEILGEPLPASFLPEKTDPGAEEEDVIRCICGLYKDEGVMIQCERCMVWQHCDCVKADDSCEHYLCEKCEPRNVNYEILMEPPPEYAQAGQTHYVTLMRGNLQFRVGDAVYVLRDMLEESISGNSPPRKVTYKTIKNVNFADLDIFRIERLWIDEKGAKFAFGHHYLRPHETYHEPTRKFFVNEVMRVPLYEMVPLDLIMQQCWVLDLATYCKGRPVGAPEEHVYICEYRVDKTAHLFARIAKPYPICTKNYAFDKFDTRLRPVRTYTPHGEVPTKGRARSNTRSTNGEEGRRHDSDEELPLARVRDHAHAAKRDVQKKRLNKILLNLLNRLPKQQPLDVTYLLEPVKRARCKSNAKKAPT